MARDSNTGALGKGAVVGVNTGQWTSPEQHLDQAWPLNSSSTLYNTHLFRFFAILVDLLVCLCTVSLRTVFLRVLLFTALFCMHTRRFSGAQLPSSGIPLAQGAGAKKSSGGPQCWRKVGRLGSGILPHLQHHPLQGQGNYQS